VRITCKNYDIAYCRLLALCLSANPHGRFLIFHRLTSLLDHVYRLGIDRVPYRGGRERVPLAGGEQLGRGQGREGIPAHDHRLVQGIRLRDCRRQEARPQRGQLASFNNLN